jgi:hypothetical protein
MLDGGLKWILAALLIASSLLLGALAINLLPGLPEARKKNVTVFYPPHADTFGVSLFLEPPVATLQVQGDTSEDQLLSLQFTNRLETPAQLGSLTAFPQNCFTLLPDPSGATPSAWSPLAPHQTAVALLRLKLPAERRECLGQRPLILRYTWTALSAPTPHTRKKPAKRTRRGKGKVAPPPPPILQQATISTSPIEIITQARRSWERFFHVTAVVCGAVLIPIFLALFTYTYQVGQAKRDALQERQALQFEVWKIIFPRLSRAIEKYYIGISRQMDLLRVETKEPAATADFDSLFAALFTLRKQFEIFLEDKGGYSFRTKPAENLCANLTNRFWDACYGFSADKDTFLATAGMFDPKFTLNQAKQKLAALGTADPAVRTLQLQFKTALSTGNNLKNFDHHLELIVSILDFECDRPYYPEWYTIAPQIKLASFTATGLCLSPAHQQEVQALIETYIADIARECRA